MIESYLDCVTGDTLIEAKELANEQMQRMINSNWMMVQCQHSYVEKDKYHIYSMVYQRTKEQVIKQVPLPQFNLEEADKAKEQPKLSGDEK
jgi:hypothetical protein